VNSYELVMLFDPAQGEEKMGQLVSKIEGKIKDLGGSLSKTDKWGIRSLPVRLQRHQKLKQAYYVVIYFEAESSLPAKVQNTLKVTENIVRYSIMRAGPKPAVEAEAAPEGVEAVEVGEIKGAEDAVGKS